MLFLASSLTLLFLLNTVAIANYNFILFLYRFSQFYIAA